MEASEAVSADEGHKEGSDAGFLEDPGEAGLVSVIVPAFNRQELIGQALDSLAAQSYHSIQMVVIDDGSDDDTSGAVRAWHTRNPHCRLKLIRQTNRGVAAARNTGLRHAKGEFIYFLDSDDVAEPDVLSVTVRVLRARQNIPLVLGYVRNSDLDGNEIVEDRSGMTRLDSVDVIRSHWLLFAALYRRSALRKAGPFNETLKMGEDTEFNWRVLTANGTGMYLDRCFGSRRHHNFGHLYIDSDDQERMSRSLKMHMAFGDWLASHPCYAGAVRLRGIIQTNSYYQRHGHKLGQEFWEELAKLYDHISPHTPIANAVLRFFCKSWARPIYYVGYRLIRFPGNMVFRISNISNSRWRYPNQAGWRDGR